MLLSDWIVVKSSVLALNADKVDHCTAPSPLPFTLYQHYSRVFSPNPPSCPIISLLPNSRTVNPGFNSLLNKSSFIKAFRTFIIFESHDLHISPISLRPYLPYRDIII